MDAQSLKQILRDTTKTLSSYLTYQAVLTVFAQLDETDPKRAYRFHQFSTKQSIRDGETYLRALFQEDRELAFRLLTVRAAIATEVADLLPEALRSSIEQANLEHRKEQLERMTQVADIQPTDIQSPDIQSANSQLADIQPQNLAPEAGIDAPADNSTFPRDDSPASDSP
jgi:RbcX protein